MLAACFFCHLQDQQQAQGHQQLFIRALPEEEEEDGQQQQVPGIHTAQVKLVQQMPEQAAEAVRPILAGGGRIRACLLYTSPSPRDQRGSRMPSSA